MPASAKQPVEPYWYVLPDDRNEKPEKQSRFFLRPLDVAEYMELNDGISSLTGSADGTITARSRNWSVSLDLVLDHLIKTENFPVGGPDGVRDSWRADWTREQKIKYLSEHMHRDNVMIMGTDLRLAADMSTEAKNFSGRALTSTPRAPSRTNRGSTTATRARKRGTAN